LAGEGDGVHCGENSRWKRVKLEGRIQNAEVKTGTRDTDGAKLNVHILTSAF
jgi:hypothetical protein